MANDKIIRCLDTTDSSVTTSAHCEGISEEILCRTINERKVRIVFLPDCFSPGCSNSLKDCCQEAQPAVGHGAPHIHISFDCPRLPGFHVFPFCSFSSYVAYAMAQSVRRGQGLVRVLFLVDGMALEQGWLRVLLFSPVSVIPPFLLSHSFICYRPCMCNLTNLQRR